MTLHAQRKMYKQYYIRTELRDITINVLQPDPDGLNALDSLTALDVYPAEVLEVRDSFGNSVNLPCPSATRPAYCPPAQKSTEPLTLNQMLLLKAFEYLRENTQTSLAKKSGVNMSTLSLWLKPRSTSKNSKTCGQHLSMGNFEKLSRALNIEWEIKKS